MLDDIKIWAPVVTIFGFIGSLIAGWISHVFWGFNQLMSNPTTGEVVLFLVGTLIAPVGVLHGWFLWVTWIF